MFSVYLYWPRSKLRAYNFTQVKERHPLRGIVEIIYNQAFSLFDIAPSFVAEAANVFVIVQNGPMASYVRIDIEAFYQLDCLQVGIDVEICGRHCWPTFQRKHNRTVYCVGAIQRAISAIQ